MPDDGTGDGSIDQRTAFLDAGVQLLEQAAANVSLRALTVRAVTKRAQRSTGAFYHYWETQADYVADLVRHLLDPDNSIARDPITSALASVAGAELDADRLLQLFDFACDDQAASHTNRMRMLLWSLDDDSVLEELRALYRRYQEAFSPIYAEMFAGLRPAHGLTWADFAVLVTAALDGVAVRRRIDPDVASTRLASVLVSIILVSVLEPDGQPVRSEDPRVRLERLVGNG